MQKITEWWSKGMDARPRVMEPGPIPAIGEMLSGETKWLWAHCQRMSCCHYAPVALAPFAIRWGMHASTNMLRERLKCSKCGKKGEVALTRPSWAGQDQGWQAWPETY
jgi:hypothetical protein